MNNDRSQRVTRGVERTPNRAMLRAVGFGDADFDKPIVGVANGYSTITPCNIGLNALAERTIDSLREAGTMPQVFGTITVSDGISMGTEGMKYSLVSREVIADSIETVCQAQSVDGLVAVGGCDKNMPGAMIGIARLNIPSIFVRPDTTMKQTLPSPALLRPLVSSARIGSTKNNCGKLSVTRVPERVHAAECSRRIRCRRLLKRWE